jgi:NTP pyrophosphatase (non-canonical NTP hydrolase)
MEVTMETQESVSKWSADTFGDAGTNLRVAVRANEEMAELLRALSIKDDNPAAASEIADVMIVLYRLAQRMGINVQEQIDLKMVINRSRVWSKPDASGCGYHVRHK